MNKELIQDVKQPKRRLAEVLPKSNHRYSSVDESSAVNAGSGRRGARTAVWAILIIIVVLIPLVYLMSQTFTRAMVAVTPKQVSLPVADTLQGVALPTEFDVTRPTTIGFQMMTIQATEKMNLAATEKSTVAERASGRIIITNLYSSRPQKLVANTRFETPGGKIYRIKEEAIVPGYVLTSGKITAGELEVTIYADRPGPEYNGEIKTLTIPGFKSDQRYDKITARGETPFVGGFTGERLLVAPEAKLTGEKELIARLTKELENEAAASLPEGFIFYRAAGGEFLKFQSQIENNDSASQLTLKLDGELTVLIFSKRELSRRLAALHLPDYDKAEVEIENLDALQFSLLDQENLDAANIKEIKELSFRLSGAAQLVWQFDVTTLTSALAGIKKSDYERVFIKYPGIAKAEVTIQPPWLTRFPSDPAKIKVQIIGVDR